MIATTAIFFGVLLGGLLLVAMWGAFSTNYDDDQDP